MSISIGRLIRRLSICCLFYLITQPTAQAATVEMAFTGRPPGSSITVPDVTVTVDTTLLGALANVRLFTLTVRDAGAGVVSAVVRHGVVSVGNCTGDAIAYFEVDQANGIQTVSFDGMRGISAPSGLCIDVLSGTVSVNFSGVIESNP